MSTNQSRSEAARRQARNTTGTKWARDPRKNVGTSDIQQKNLPFTPGMFGARDKGVKQFLEPSMKDIITKSSEIKEGIRHGAYDESIKRNLQKALRLDEQQAVRLFELNPGEYRDITVSRLNAVVQKSYAVKSEQAVQSLRSNLEQAGMETERSDSYLGCVLTVDGKEYNMNPDYGEPRKLDEAFHSYGIARAFESNPAWLAADVRSSSCDSKSGKSAKASIMSDSPTTMEVGQDMNARADFTQSDLKQLLKSSPVVEHSPVTTIILETHAGTETISMNEIMDE